MNKLKPLIFVGLLGLLNSGCQMGYLIKSSYHQMGLLYHREPIEKALQDSSLSDEDKRKLLLSQKARLFAEGELHLKVTQNYTSFVKLDRPYVTYVVSAAPKWELKHHFFSYPFVGKMPYKGYFNEADAKELDAEMQRDDFDTFRRGVSAYSTLGWFNDPILSSMLRYKDYDLVNTIIHETVHATLYIKHEADFNERLATFLGNKGMEIFYLKEEGIDSPTLQKVKADNVDDRLFSVFISRELKSLEDWYSNLQLADRNEDSRKKRIQQIQVNFEKDLLPQLKGDAYKRFGEIDLNNARLLVYRTYMQDLSDFETLYQKENGNFGRFIQRCKTLENAKDPVIALKQLLGEGNP